MQSPPDVLTVGVDRLLFALRAIGPHHRVDAHDPDCWRAPCPVCGGISRFVVRERHGDVQFECKLQCSNESIFRALKLAEVAYPHRWGGHSPANDLPHIEAMIAEGEQIAGVVRTLQRELVAA
jgi:hypothetical protein